MVPVRSQDWELLGRVTTTSIPASPLVYDPPHIYLTNMLKLSHGSSTTTITSLTLSTISMTTSWPGPLVPRPAATTYNASFRCAGNLAFLLPRRKWRVLLPSSRTFLGLELDSLKQQIRLPTDKLQDLLSELNSWLQRKKTTKRELLSLIGKLSFAAKAIPAGRIFTRRLISLSTTATKLRHHLRLNKQAREDLLWWQKFLPTWNGTAHFIDPTSTPASDLDLCASGAIGYGAYFRGNWFHYSWQPHQKLSPHTSIQWQELFAILAATLTWGHQWGRKRIRFFCDNLAIVQAWQNMSAHDSSCFHYGLLWLSQSQRVHRANLKGLQSTHSPICSKYPLVKKLLPVPP